MRVPVSRLAGFLTLLPSAIFLGCCLILSPFALGERPLVSFPSLAHIDTSTQIVNTDLDELPNRLSFAKILMAILVAIGAFGAWLINLVGKPDPPPSALGGGTKMEKSRIKEREELADKCAVFMASSLIAGLLLLPSAVLCFHCLEGKAGIIPSCIIPWLSLLSVLGSVHFLCSVFLLWLLKSSLRKASIAGSIWGPATGQAKTLHRVLCYIAVYGPLIGLSGYLVWQLVANTWKTPSPLVFVTFLALYGLALVLSFHLLWRRFTGIRPTIVCVLLFDSNKNMLYVKLDPEEEEGVKDRWFVPAAFADEGESRRVTAAKTLCRYLVRAGMKNINVEFCEVSLIGYELRPEHGDIKPPELAKAIMAAERNVAEHGKRTPSEISLFVAHPDAQTKADVANYAQNSKTIKYGYAKGDGVEDLFPRGQGKDKEERELLPLLKPICDLVSNF